MSMSINDTWKKFFKSDNFEDDIVGIIKIVMKSYLDYLIHEKLLEEIPTDDINYQSFKNANDITDVMKILSLELNLNGLGPTRADQVAQKLKNKMPRDRYQIEINKQTETILRLEKYKEFIDTSHNIRKARNSANHNRSRNDSGWALMVASAIFNLIDLSPVKIDQNSAERLRSQNLRLLEKVREIEVYDEEAEEEMEEDASLKVENILGDQLIEEMQSSLEEFSAGLTSQISIIENRVISIHESLEKKESPPGSYESLREQDEADRKEFYEKMASELTQEEWDEEFGAEYSWEQFEKEDTFSNPEILRKELITVQQAERELLTLQKEIKRTFACENWENIAQGPFREQIFLSKIVDKEAWLDNEFISNRYNEYSFVMDNQLNSEIGNRYFEILSQITWDS